MKAEIGKIQHFNVHDGRGIRTIVFFQGCALNCAWCQNPEYIERRPVLMYNDSLCVGCGACISVCKDKAIKIDSAKAIIDWEKCNSCFQCVKQCYFSARTYSSSLNSVEDVFYELMKDECFYEKSGGGVTFSGGEALLQIDFCLNLASRLKEKNISLNIETAGFVPWENIERIIQYTDVFLYDIKLIDRKKSKKYLGTDSLIMLNNLRQLVKKHSKIVIRIPLIPGVNDDDEFEKIISFINTLDAIKTVHILPFHQIGSGKYRMIGKKYSMMNVMENNKYNIEKCRRMMSRFIKDVDVGGSNFI
ncbi:glycyl-radical enzyme activating protein [Propionispira raffinosivorans]|uniref:glycyl-radical enzyme activating protein n=1 Tax=Propionispira raffinosivorans TaxID=86959 RepID=UPI0003803D08|nr:glycyl-radical enzyme activating protein [Propionispira raffinosivorans]